jgi:5-methyltetrahydropteroyltriglutamate--homocysteine methyltransferase
VQFDEPAFNVFTEDVKEWGIAALHKAIEGLPCQTAVHICYGYGIQENIDWKETLGSEWRQYEEIFPVINESKIDQVSLECANSKVPMSLIGLLKDKQVMVGVIDVASFETETPEQVAAVIHEAGKYVSSEQILPCTNCGMAPLPRDLALKKLQALAEGARLASGNH